MNLFTKYKQYSDGILYKAERAHYDKLFDSYKSNMKKSWELIAEIINKKSGKRSSKGNFVSKDGQPLSEKEIANNFNDFFCECGADLG